MYSSEAFANGVCDRNHRQSDFAGDTHVVATYGEVFLPLSPRFEATGALRYADSGDGVGDSLDPS